MKRATLADRYCPVARSASQIKDGWSFVLLREFMLGARRFSELQDRTGMSPRSLSLRLHEFEADDLAVKVPGDGAAPTQYRLTRKGLDLYPVLLALKAWGDRWVGPWDDDQTALRISHGIDDHDVEPALTCGACEEPIDPRDVTLTMSPAMVADRTDVASHASRKKS